MRLFYAGFDFGLVSCHAYDTEPVYDDVSGSDLLYHRIRAVFTGVINPAMTATGKTGDSGGYGIPGDSAGISLDKIKDLVETPRQNLQIYIGPDLLVDCPGILEDLPCDPEGGPLPGPLQITSNTGDKTLTFRWSITFVTSQCGRYLLSNRWTHQVSVNNSGMSSRVVTGTARFRADYLYDEGLTPDSFRQWLVLPCPVFMRRHSIEVKQSSDNTRLDYTVVDRQVNYGLAPLAPPPSGPNPLSLYPGITRISGHVTVGASTPTSGVLGFLNRLGGWLGLKPEESPGALISGLAGWAQMNGSQAKASALVRVYGQPNTDKYFMVRVANAVINDRLEPLIIKGNLPLIGQFTSQSIDSEEEPWIEVRTDGLPINTVALESMINPMVGATMMNLNQNFILFGKPNPATGSIDPPYIVLNADTAGTPLPNGNNTRGNWLGSIAVAALNPGACTVPFNAASIPNQKVEIPNSSAVIPPPFVP